MSSASRTIRIVTGAGLVFLLNACGTGPQGETKSLPDDTVVVSPGELIALSGRVEEPVGWTTDKGVVLEEGSRSWYLPPLHDGSYSTYAVAGQDSVYRLDVAVHGHEPAALTGVEFDESGGVAGRYGRTPFAAHLTADGFGEARFGPRNGEVSSRVTDYDQGIVEWRGVTFDGKGELSKDEAMALKELVESDVASALALTSIDLACREGAEGIHPAVGAALLLPWQIMLKYTAPYPATVARHYARMSSCRYFPDATQGAASRDKQSPSPGVMMLGLETPIPAALFYFPLDGEGGLQFPPLPSSQ